MAKTKVAVAWLKREDWPRWQQIDPELPPYKIWLTKIEATLALLKHRGQLF